MIRFGSVCSGIEAASVAWAPLGWKAAWLSEIDRFASALLAQRFPDVPNLGDMTALPARIRAGEIEAPDVFTGGTPCQAYSVAGNRGGLADPRGNLTLTFVEIADAIDEQRAQQQKPAAVIVWENVPGVLSSKDNAFGCFLAGLAGEDQPLQPAGGRWSNAGAVFGPRRAVAWRVLDAQFFGLAQRRRRVFLVASARPDFDPAFALFECGRRRRDTAPGREAPQNLAGTLTASAARQRGAGISDTGLTVTPETARTLSTSNQRLDWETETFAVQCADALAFHGSQDPDVSGDVTHPCGRNQGQETCALVGERVRRLTPRECERLQGFPDDWTLIPWRGKPAEQCPDGPRYKAIGNSWAVPCARWVGQQIRDALTWA